MPFWPGVLPGTRGDLLFLDSFYLVSHSMLPKGAFNTQLFTLTSQYYSQFIGKQADRTSRRSQNEFVRALWLEATEYPTQLVFSKKENILVHIKKMSSVRMVSGRAGSRGPNDVMKTQFHPSHPSFTSFFLCCFNSQALPSRWQEYYQQARAIEQGWANSSHKGWPPGFVNKTELNTAMPICAHLTVGCFHAAGSLVSICNTAVWSIKPKVFRICLYGVC